MPHPLSSLSPDEQLLYGSLAAYPMDTLILSALADAAEERGHQQRADLLRRHSRLALYELLRGKILADAECPTRIDNQHMERDLSAALGTPEHEDEMLTLLTKDGQLDIQRLREQYDFQVTLLASLDLLEEQQGHLGITGIDGRFHALPSLESIQSRFDTPALRRKVAQGFNQLLLVPFALPLHRLLDAWRRGLLRNETLLAAYGGLDRDEPVWLWEEGYGLQNGIGPDEDGRLVYLPQRFAADHGGQTKAQILENVPPPPRRCCSSRARSQTSRAQVKGRPSPGAGRSGWDAHPGSTWRRCRRERPAGRPRPTSLPSSPPWSTRASRSMFILSPTCQVPICQAPATCRLRAGLGTAVGRAWAGAFPATTVRAGVRGAR